MTTPASVTAIVLAGGRSSRFGGPKLSVDIGGVVLLDHAIAAVRDLAGEILVAGGSPEPPRASPTVRTVADEEPFAGPLAALAGALRSTTTELAILVGGDMPGLVPAVLRTMLERLASAQATDLDAVFLAAPAGDPARRQVLPLALRVATATPAAAAALDAGDRSLVRLLDRLRSAEIPAAEWLALDPGGRTLLDVDRPEDIQGILRELR